MNEQIQRLGFDAWAHNKFVNAIEDFVEGNEGSITVESDDFRINLWWDDKTVNCAIAAYAEGKWQNYSNDCKRIDL